jgi:hypothetical protein
VTSDFHSACSSDFSNVLSKTAIERLADADEYEVVREVQVRTPCFADAPEIDTGNQEYFADYAPLLPCLFSLNYMPSPKTPLYGSSPNSWDLEALDRHVQGLIALLLSLKKKPVIRYERMSGMAKKLAGEIQVRHILRQALVWLREATTAPHIKRVATLRLPANPGPTVAPHSRPEE